jgi:hypothetical protein
MSFIAFFPYCPQMIKVSLILESGSCVNERTSGALYRHDSRIAANEPIEPMTLGDMRANDVALTR